MKTLGLIGGMSWESTQLYYRAINEGVKARLGGLHSAQLVLWSFDFAEIAELQKAGNWNEATKRMVEAGNGLKRAGAEALLICTNTMHVMASEVETGTGLKVLHIADATAQAVRAQSLSKIGLLGTRFTMEQDFYRLRLQDQGIETIIPAEAERADVHSIIFDELCQGHINSASKARYLEIIDNLVKQGAQGIVLGCTEIGLLIAQPDVKVPVFDTAALHAEMAVEWIGN